MSGASTYFVLTLALAGAALAGCTGNDGDEDPGNSSGGSSQSSGSGSTGSGGSASSGSGSGSGGQTGAGGASGGSSGATGTGGASGGSVGDGGSAGSGGGTSGAGGSAGGAGDGGGGGSPEDPCGGCTAPEVCIYQVGGPGSSRFLCAEQVPCGAPGACACIPNQGTCQYQPGEGETPGYCVCDNGLD